MTSPTSSVGGLVSGMDTNALVDQLMALQRAPVNKMTSKQSLLNQQKIAWNKLEANAKSIADKAQVLSSLSRLYAPTTTSTTPEAVSVTGTAAAGTSLAFKVTSLASASQSAVTGFTSAAQVVNAGTVTVSSGLASLGVAKASVTGVGSHTLTVTASSTAASLTSSVAGAGYTSTGGDLQLSVNGGAALTVNLAAGTYTAAQLADTINATLAGSGARAEVVGGTLSVKSTGEGSGATLSVVGGTEAAGLGLAGGSGAGTDGVLDVDGTSVAVTDARAGAAITVGGATLTLSGGLRVGTATAKVASVSAGATLADVAAAVNATGAAAATILSTGDPTLGTELMFTAKSTGLAGEVSVSLDGFAGGYQTTTIRNASDATLVMGQQTITRSSNTISDLVSGAVLTLKQTTSTEVAITSTRDDTAVAGKVKDFVASINTFLADQATYTKTDPSGKTPGILNGDSSLRSLNLSMMRTLTSSYGSGPISVLSQVGIRVQRDGTVAFDEAAFTKALADNPDGVADLLSRTGSSTSAQMSFSSATSATKAGSYTVSVTQAATMASLTSSAWATLPGPEDFTFTVGTTSATYSAAAGLTGSDLSVKMNAFFTAKGLALLADYSGGALSVHTKGYGSTARFTASSSAGTLSGTASGTDVAGTINGVAATGAGQILSAPAGSAAAGLGVKVTATGADIAAAGGSLALGTLTFDEGLGGAFDTLIGTARGGNGLLHGALDSIERQSKLLDANIAAMNVRLDMKESRLRAQFSAMELALSRVQSSMPDFSSMSNMWSSRD